MLLRFAKLVGGCRLLVAETAPLVVTSVSVLSVRSAAYLVGFTLGSIASVWLPIVAVLISVTGLFGLFSGFSECDAYRAQIAEIDAENQLALENYKNSRIPFDKLAAEQDKLIDDYYKNNPPDYSICPPYDHEKYSELVRLARLDFEKRVQFWSDQSTSYHLRHSFPVYTSPYEIHSECMKMIDDKIRYAAPSFEPLSYPISPTLKSYPCSGGSGGGPDCPAGKKVWLQVIWGSPTGNFSDSKGCFIVGYSQDAPDLPFNIEYNPFLPEPFVKSMALSYYSVQGDRFRQLDNPNWKNLESVHGWDKGHWIAESVNPECRGWHPGWSRKIK